ncbi:MAG: hypothetical protein JXB42_13460 [Deltaproteobacteria bacterium]|nr:hypothetical protein [Deltaproteobacteria bacterium]
MSVGNKVMIFGLGDLGGWVLEFLARRQGVTTIIGCDKRADWGSKKVNVTASGAGAEGYDKVLKFEECDVFDVDRTAELISKYQPDFIYSGMTLMSWVIYTYLPKEMHQKANRIAGGPVVPVHLTLIYKLMQAVQKSGTNPVVLNNSWPDVVNPMLWGAGYKVLVGGGNVDNIVNEIKRKISVKENVPISAVTVYFICEHVINVMGTRTGIPYFMKIMIGDKDITDKYDCDSLISDRLMAPCPPEWISWIVHPEVAASTVKNIMAVLNDTNEFTHSPGPNGMLGGYPMRIGANGITIELPEGMTMEQAVKYNMDQAKYEGVEEIKEDGTLIVTDEAYQITKEMLGIECREIKVADTADWSSELVAAFKKLGEKYNAKVPVY